MFFYKITFFDEISNQVATEQGLVAAKTYGNAAKTLCDYYGDNITNELYLKFLTEDSFITTQEIKENIKENN